MEGLASVRQLHPVATAVQQAQAQLLLQLGHRSKHRGVRSVQPVSRRLKAPPCHNRIEALQLMEREVRHCLFYLQSSFKLYSIYETARILG